MCAGSIPETASGLEDERVHIYNSDALRFLRSKQDMYDLIINDATDPFGASEGLFTREFYGNCYKALKEDGILVYQHGSPFYDEDEDACRSMHRKVFHTFPISRLRISSRQSGREEIYIQNITQLIFIQVHSCCQSMLKNY